MCDNNANYYDVIYSCHNMLSQISCVRVLPSVRQYLYLPSCFSINYSCAPAISISQRCHYNNNVL